MLSLVATSLIYELGYALRGPRSDGLIGSLKMRPTVHMIAIPLCYETRSSAMDRFFDAQQRTGAWESLCAPSLRTLSSVQRQIHTWEHGYALAGPCSFDAYLVSPRLYDTPADSRVGARTKHTQIGRRQESAVRAKKCLGTIESATTATSAISMERNSTGALSANDGASKTISKNSLSYQGGQAFRFAARSRACSTLLQSVAGARRSFLCLRSEKREQYFNAIEAGRSTPPSQKGLLLQGEAPSLTVTIRQGNGEKGVQRMPALLRASLCPAQPRSRQTPRQEE